MTAASGRVINCLFYSIIAYCNRMVFLKSKLIIITHIPVYFSTWYDIFCGRDITVTNNLIIIHIDQTSMFTQIASLSITRQQKSRYII